MDMKDAEIAIRGIDLEIKALSEMVVDHENEIQRLSRMIQSMAEKLGERDMEPRIHHHLRKFEND